MQLTGEARELIILNIVKRLIIGALEFDANGIIVTAVASAPGRLPGVPCPRAKIPTR